MQNANELLYQILQVVGKIEANQRGAAKPAATVPGPAGSGDGSIASKLGGALKSFAGIGPKSTKTFFTFLRGMMDISSKSKDKDVKKMQTIADSLGIMGNSLPSIAEGLGDLGKIRTKQVERAIWSLDQLYEFMAESGEAKKRRKVENAVKTFEKMGKALKDVAKPVKDISLSFAYLGLGILALAGSLVLTGMLLGLAKPTDVLLFLGGLVVGVLLMFGLLWMAKKIVDKGTDVIKDIGLGMAALSLGILSFAITLVLLPKILGGESGGSIIKSMLMIVGIVAAMALIFTILGAMKSMTFKGFMSIVWMSAGLVVLSIGILALATTAKLLMTGMTPASATDEEKDKNKKFIMKGLGVIGLITLAAVGLFALLGTPVVAGLVMTGAITMILLSAALILLAKSIGKLVETGKALEGEDIGQRLTVLIGGTLEGFIGGLSVLSGGKKGVAGIAEFIKNSAKIFAGTAVLMSMSLALSQFAKAITAFAELENMRIIEGYDKDGKPIFGAKVNVTKVASNITTSISSFLAALIASTEGLTKDQAGAIRKMGRALTGRRGILSAVIMFADVLKTFAQFGPNGEIGFVDLVPDGNDEDGNAKFKQVASKVKITDVVTNIVESFAQFVKGITDHTKDFEFDGKQGKAMMELSAALLGTEAFSAFGIKFGRSKPGLLVGISKFSEILAIYAKYGAELKIPILDAEGKEIGTPLDVKTVADNIMKSLSAFITSISTSTTLSDETIKSAESKLSKVDGVLEKLHKIATSTDGLSRFSAAVKDLGSGMGDLAVSIEKMDAEKLSDILKRISEGSLEISTSSKSYAGASAASTTTSSSKGKETAMTTKTGEPKWDVIAAQIGLSVGQQITEAMKKGQVKFEFSGTGSNKGILELG
ncbi:MAG TPA: hypothetical protein PK122_02400 [Candidatus Paceibacterota bacterium]|nr:hypothetical protein [Candidatus Paceibacterota bacterium]